MTKKRGCLLGLLIAGVLVIGGALAAYAYLSTFVNPAGFVGEGEAIVPELPDGFEVNVFASDLLRPRFMATGPDGTLFVADRGNNRIVALPDADGDGRADETIVFADEIPSPHSLIWHDGAWYVGITSGVLKLVDEDGDGRADERSVVIDDYPTSGTHSTRTIEFLPSGEMVVSVGSSCNVCDEEDERRAAVVIYDDATGSNERVYASGLRNAVGLAVQPETGLLWASNNGRDLMGDDLPPEDIYIVEEGGHYGWPRCHSGRIVDPDMGQEGDCDGVVPPIVEMQAHSAPLGITFYNGDAFPAEYQGDLFIAFHGSWNRSIPTGYKVVRLPLDEEGNPAADQVEDFATGWLNEATEDVYGRPVGVTVGGDGALYVSDDKGGFIYRISYANEN